MPIQLESTYTAVDPRLFTISKAVKMPLVSEVVFNQALATELNLNTLLASSERSYVLTGQKNAGTALPFAQAYSGHQFGHFTRLGDGRALVLGEFCDASGQRYDLQLKGSGPTSYSRRGDGMATLSSMLREYLISESMHGLGIPTSRSLAVHKTGLEVDRGQLFEGAVLARVAKSHIRVGTFEFVAEHQDESLLEQFTKYTIDRHYPAAKESDQPVKAFLEMAVDAQVKLVVNWMRVGFIHGVMNTDNMAVSGETIDYGPCAFMNEFDWGAVFSSIDTQGRYAFGRQAPIAQWNLACLASALLPLLDSNQQRAMESAQETIDSFVSKFENAYLNMMRFKVGIPHAIQGDVDLITDLTTWMQNNSADYTATFWALESREHETDPIFFNDEFEKIVGELHRLRASNHIPAEVSDRLMASNNPKFIPRNVWVEKALLEATENNDLSFFNKLLEASQNPYSSKIDEAFAHRIPASSQHYKTYCGT